MWVIRFVTLALLFMCGIAFAKPGVAIKVVATGSSLIILGLYIFSEIIRSMIETAEYYEWQLSLSDLSDFDTISAHTYKPDNAVVPARGWIILGEVHEAIKRYGCKVLFNVGHTVSGERRTESEIYRDAYVSRYGHDAEIIVAADESVRETQAEVFHTVERIEELHSHRHMLIILAPHLKRAMKSWKRFLPLRYGAEMVIKPVPAPARYWIWEALMLVIVFFLPPGSKRQEFVLTMVGRKG
jgi:hypothetical protein